MRANNLIQPIQNAKALLETILPPSNIGKQGPKGGGLDQKRRLSHRNLHSGMLCDTLLVPPEQISVTAQEPFGFFDHRCRWWTILARGKPQAHEATAGQT